jgi:sigma-E factor negative regulatory protein RseC
VIREDARVLSVETGFAWVEIPRRSSCSRCSASSSCGTSVVAKLLGERTNRLRVSDGIGVEVGDRVVIGIADSALTRASVLAYLLPLAALMLTAFAAQTAGAEDGVVALTGILGLALGLWVTGRLTGGASARERYRAVLLHRLAPQGICVPGPSTMGPTCGTRLSEQSASSSPPAAAPPALPQPLPLRLERMGRAGARILLKVR